MSSSQAPKSGAVTFVGILSIIYGALNILLGVGMIFLGGFIVSLIGLGAGAAQGAAPVGDAQAQQAAKELGQAASGLAGLIIQFFTICGGLNIVYGIFPILGGTHVLNRTGKTMTFVFSIFGIILGAGYLFVALIPLAILHLGFGIPALVILLMNSGEFRTA